MGVIIGAHVSSAGALDKCLDRACEIGAQAAQIFISGPQSWKPSTHTEESIAVLRRRAVECGIVHLYLHGVYLINLATSDEALLGRSLGSLKQYLRFCELSGARGVIFHTGSHKGAGFAAVEGQIVAALCEVLEAVPGGSWLILENSAGQGGTVGARFAELGALIRGVDSPRVRVCLDTCHAFAAGYDLTTPEGVAATLAEFDREVGLDRLVAVHANDSKAGLGSGLDRHENIGQGHLGEAAFQAMLAHPALRAVPFLLEVPGLAGKGPDIENVAVLRRLAGLPPLPAGVTIASQR